MDGTTGGVGVASGVQLEKFRLYSVGDLKELPKPEWLVEGLIEERSFPVLYGPSGDGKSFLALDFALCVATGVSWHGRTVHKGPVVYVAAEGRSGIAKRVFAWQEDHPGIEVDSAFFILEPVQVRMPSDLNLLVQKIQGANLRPRLIVIDTFARCFEGGEENSSKEVGEFIGGIQRLQRDTGEPAILLVHHTGKGDKEQERGSSALRGAADTMLLLRKQESKLTLTCNKQKDGDEGGEIRLELQPMLLGNDGESGLPITSCVVNGSAEAVKKEPAMAKAKAATKAEVQQLLEVLKKHPEGLSVDGLQEEAKVAGIKHTAESTIRRHLAALGESVEQVPGQEGRYRATVNRQLTVIEGSLKAA